MIKEPPVRLKTTERFRPWSTFKIGWRDPKVIWLMVGVGMVLGFMQMYNAWIWLFARDMLNLQRADIAGALSWATLVSVLAAFPMGWVVDRFSGYKVVAVFWLMCLGAFAFTLQMDVPRDLILLSFMMVFTSPLYTAADIMVYRHSKPEDIGSVTSSNSFLRNLLVGGAMAGSSWLIERDGTKDYHAAFAFGMIVCTAGFAAILFYGWLSRRRTRAGAAAQAL